MAGNLLQKMVRRFSFSNQTFEEKNFSMRKNWMKIHLRKAHITAMNVDVIVNAANANMSHGGGVAAFIAKSGGPELVEECQEHIKKNGKVGVSHLCKTTGGNMRCYWVYHAVGPRWRNYKNDEKERCGQDLCETILRCLKQCEKDHCRSIALPSISSGIFRVPKDVCADMYLKAVERFDSENDVKFLEDIYFVDTNIKNLEKIGVLIEKNLDLKRK